MRVLVTSKDVARAIGITSVRSPGHVMIRLDDDADITSHRAVSPSQAAFGFAYGQHLDDRAAHIALDVERAWATMGAHACMTLVPIRCERRAA